MKRRKSSDRKESFSNSAYAEQMHLEDGELSAFMSTVGRLFGSEQACLSVEDWLDESDLLDSPPLSTGRNWRAVTVAAAARLANRVNVAQHWASMSSWLEVFSCTH
jgi:hypothetical protein